MLRHVSLTNFKSFGEATVSFGPFTLLVGANASGKSNIREALRVLHGIGRGYTLAEVLGERWGRSGELEWKGPRGGAPQAMRRGSDEFTLRAEFTVPQSNGASSDTLDVEYEITIGLRDGGVPVLNRERFATGLLSYDTHPCGEPLGQGDGQVITAELGSSSRSLQHTYRADRPILTQIYADEKRPGIRGALEPLVDYLESMRFLDLDPDLARRSSARGVTTLGDHGQNLSSVLAALADDPKVIGGVSAWIRALTPMDASGIDFDTDLNNQTLAVLIEDNGERTPLSAASDGTVRFLAMVALLYSPEVPSIIFLEEIENGIHPHRISLLLDLLEQRVGAGDRQVIATSHSPQLVQDTWDAEGSLPVLVARLPEGGSVAVDLKHDAAMRGVLGTDNDAVGTPAELMVDGWFEDFTALAYPAGDDA